MNRKIIFLNVFLNLKSKHITKGAIEQIENKRGKITCKSISLENPNRKKAKIKPKQKN